MQEFWKSVEIRQSYHEKFDALFYETVYIGYVVGLMVCFRVNNSY